MLLTWPVKYAAFSKNVKSGDYVSGYMANRLGYGKKNCLVCFLTFFQSMPVNVNEDLIRVTMEETLKVLK